MFLSSSQSSTYPRIKDKDFQKWNETMFAKFHNELFFHPNPIVRFIENRRKRNLIRLLDARKTDVILAAGCGEGYIERQISGFKHLYLVDYSSTAISLAKANLGQSQELTYLRANLEKLPYPNKFFDKIMCSEVIEHTPHPQKLLQEFHRILKDDGFLIISFPNEPFINFLKSILLRLQLFSLFFPGISKNMLAEWHLHSFDYQVFHRLANHKWTTLVSIPNPLPFLPICYILKCRKFKL